jgi:hypothetical protein
LTKSNDLVVESSASAKQLAKSGKDKWEWQATITDDFGNLDGCPGLL